MDERTPIAVCCLHAQEKHNQSLIFCSDVNYWQPLLSLLLFFPQITQVFYKQSQLFLYSRIFIWAGDVHIFTFGVIRVKWRGLCTTWFGNTKIATSPKYNSDRKGLEAQSLSFGEP